MADMLNIPNLGKLEIVETYAYYDQPVLFSCRNAAGHLYLVVAADENDQYDTWLYAGVSPERLNHIRSGAIDLHGAFANPEGGFLLQVMVSYDGQTPLRTQLVEPNQLSKDMFPIPGERLDLKTETFSVLSNSEQIAETSGREALNLTLYFAGDHKTEAPVVPFIEIVGGIQQVINRIRMVVTNSSRITEHIKREMGISLLEVEPGSFNILLASTRGADLYSDSDFGNAIGNAINEFMKLLNAGNDPEQLKQLLEQLRSKVAEDYTQLLKSLSKSVIDTRFKWTSPNPDRGGTASLSKSQMQGAIEILKRFQNEPLPTFEVTGTLTGVWLRSKRFQIETTEDTYTGKIADIVFETVSKPTVNQEYTAEIQEINERSETTDEITKTKYQLLSLK